MPTSTSRAPAPRSPRGPAAASPRRAAPTARSPSLTSANDFADALVAIKKAPRRARRDCVSVEADRLERSGSPRHGRTRHGAARGGCRLAAPASSSPKVEEALDANLPSLLVAINGGLVKITKLSDIGITGDVLLPLDSQADGQARRLEHRHLRDAREQPQGDRPGGRVPRALQGARRGRAAASTGSSSRPATAASRSWPASAARWSARALTLLVTLVLVPADRRAGGHLSRGVRAQEPADGPDRGQHQQPRGRALDRLRPARPRDVPQLLRPAALGAAGRRPGAGAARAADDHHRRARRAEGRAALDQGGGARASAPRTSRRCSITCCRWRCPAS